MKNSLNALLGLLISLSAWTQTIDTEKLDRYFQVLEQHDKFMGSVAVSQNGKIIYSATIGFSDAENGVQADQNTKYRIGSISKTFTAVLVLKAVETNKLKLNQTIRKFFPEIPNAANITIEQLLAHRSGIADFTDEEDYRSWDTQPKTEQEMRAIITKAGSHFEPGTQSEYSNSNYLLLSYILEKKFKKTYAELLKQYIVEPLHLINTYLGGPINTGANECKSYTYDAGWKTAPETAISIALGAGGVVSTPTDLVAFSDALFNGKLLKSESLEQMKTLRDAFGLGLFQIPFYEKMAYGHRGGIDKFTSVFSYFQEDHISIALISNGTNYNNNEVALTVLNAVFQKPFEVPDFSTYDVSPEELENYPGVYSSSQVPITITIAVDSGNLTAQATGQSPALLEANGKDRFQFAGTGIILEFNPEEHTMLLKQGGGEFLFTRD